VHTLEYCLFCLAHEHPEGSRQRDELLMLATLSHDAYVPTPGSERDDAKLQEFGNTVRERLARAGVVI
jgi:hypothetical protein